MRLCKRRAGTVTPLHGRPWTVAITLVTKAAFPPCQPPASRMLHTRFLRLTLRLPLHLRLHMRRMRRTRAVVKGGGKRGDRPARAVSQGGGRPGFERPTQITKQLEFFLLTRIEPHQRCRTELCLARACPGELHCAYPIYPRDGEQTIH